VWLELFGRGHDLNLVEDEEGAWIVMIVASRIIRTSGTVIDRNAWRRLAPSMASRGSAAWPR
jgi:hypothetical protein